MLDTNLCLKTSGAVTTLTTGTGVDFGSADVQPITYVLNCTAASGTSPTLDVTIQESADNSTYYTVASIKQITTTGVERVTVKSDQRYRRAVFTTGGTGPSFTCSVYPELGGEYQKF